MNISNSTFPELFLSQIEQNNKEKPEAPLALVIQGEFDHNLSVYSQASFYNILEISKTHQVAIRILKLKSLWGQTIQQTAESYQRDISLLYIVMHGNIDSLECGKGEFLKTSDLQEEDFSLLTPNAMIILLACHSGLKIAPHLAKTAKRNVLGCKKKIEPTRTIFAGCFSSPKLLSYSKSNKPITTMYFPNGRSELLAVREEIKRQLFFEKFEYLKALASTGDPLAQIDIGDMLTAGIAVERSIQEAFHYYFKAANQGLSQAQYAIGVFYKLGGNELPQSNEQALYWFTEAAKQEHPLAQNAAGNLYHLGPAGVIQSDEWPYTGITKL